METIILASGSPRRRELLPKVKLPFKVIPPAYRRKTTPRASRCRSWWRRLARGKVEAILDAVQDRIPPLGARAGHRGGDGREGPGKALWTRGGGRHAAPALRQGPPGLHGDRPPGREREAARGGSGLHGGEVPGNGRPLRSASMSNQANGRARRGRTASRSAAHSSWSGSEAPTATS